MPRYFFDLDSADVTERDELGVEFASLDAAYLDACRAALDISVEMLRERTDPHDSTFLVRDATGRLLLEIPFGEVLRPGRKLAGPAAAVEGRSGSLADAIARSRLLRSELRARVVDAVATVSQAQAVLRRAEAGSGDGIPGCAPEGEPGRAPDA